MDHASPEDYDDRASEGGSGDDDIVPKLEDSQSSPNASGKGAKASHLQKRRRVTRACDECRRKKIKCDGKQPCTHCTVYSYECTYDQPSNRRRNPAPQYVENIEHRVHRAETLLHILIPNLDLNDPGIDAAVAQGWIPGAPGKGHPGAPGAIAAAAATQQAQRPPPVPNPEGKSDTNLESMVRAVAQMDIDEQGHWDYHGHSSGLSFMRRMREQLGDLMGPDSPATPFVKSRPRSLVLDSPRSTIDSPSDHPSSPGSELPPKEMARQFCSNAVDDAAALLKFIHKPTFWAQFERIYHTSPDSWGNEDQQFLPLLYSAMALGTLFGKDEHSNLNQVGYENAIQQGFAYFKSARHMMDIADCRDLTSVQAVIFMILFMQSSAKLSQCYAYVGVALRSALRMGLHRSYAGNWDPIEAETRKRVFWVVRKMDVYVGAMLGLPQTLSDDDIDQEFPAEVDDEYITHEGIMPMPEGQVSLLTAFNAHTRLVLLLQKIVRQVYPIKVQNQQGESDKSYTVPFSTIRELESDLEQWKTTLPPILSPCDAPERYIRVQQLLRLAYAHAQVLLYRPFLHFTAAEKRSKPVDQRAYACAASYVNVSRNIVHITTQMKHKGLLNGSFWFTMYTTFFSILSLVYFAAENPDNPTTEAVLKDAYEGKEILASLATRSMAADRCTATLDIIFERLDDWMRNGHHAPQTSKKRQHGSTPLPRLAGKPQGAQSHPDVSTLGREPPVSGFTPRSSTFPRHVPKSEPNSFMGSPWSSTSVSSPYGPATPGSTFEQRAFPDLTQPSSNPLQTPAQQPMSLPPNFANPAIPDVSAMMFPSGGDEPFLYPNQPLTTFENAQQFASGSKQNNPYISSLANGATGLDSTVGTPSSQPQQLFSNPSPSRAGRDDNMEAQFFALPPYLEQSRGPQQQPQAPPTSFPYDGVGFGGAPAGPPMTPTPSQQPNGMGPMPNGWPPQHHQQQASFNNGVGPQAQPQQQNFANINIQDLFGGAEWNAQIMDPGFRQ
ncbi:hypothetical protein Q7P37_003745 [Cladosporium fusiforme]